MFPSKVGSLSARAAANRNICQQCLRRLSTRTPRAFSPRSSPRLSTSLAISPRRTQLASARLPKSRSFASKTSADSTVEGIQEQYATAKDEFEIAAEETEKKSIYAADDRGAAREELDKLKEVYEEALKGNDAEEIKRRVGQRIRELENAIVALEERGKED